MTDYFDDQEVQEPVDQVHFNELRWLTDVYTQSQKMRLANEGRKRALDQHADDGPEMKFLLELIQQFETIETLCKKRMSKSIEQHIAWPFLKRIKGLGPTLSCKLIGLIPEGFIEKADTVSKFWRFCGQAVIDGKAEKPVKGEKLHYSVRMKTTLYLISGQFIKANSPYRLIYDEAKEYYAKNRPDWTKLRIHYASMRRMQRVFLHHLWEFWRESLKLPARKLYVHEYLQHTKEYKKEDFYSDKKPFVILAPPGKLEDLVVYSDQTMLTPNVIEKRKRGRPKKVVS